jgi:choice-of-anchor A domain-containing protein
VRARRGVFPYAAAGLAGVVLGLLVIVAAYAAPLPGGLGPCVPGDCPDPFPPVNNGDFAGRDNAISVFVGGGMRVVEGAAEAEGRVVVIGDFDMNKTAGSTVYNAGIAGVGSRVPPEDGEDFLTTGGDITIASGQTLLADRGVVRHAGTLTGAVTGTPIQDPNAAAPYAGLAPQLTAASDCYADRENVPATGTVTFAGGTFTFTGDGSSALQVFYVDQDLEGPGGASIGLSFAGIPANATVLVNVVVPGTWTFNTFSGDLADLDPWNSLRERMLWNIPTATRVDLVGVSHLQGSVLVGNPDSTTLFNKPGMAGRFFTTGDLIHAGDGSEFHSYPFDGDLPSCAGASPTPCPSASRAPAESPSPMATASPAAPSSPTVSRSPAAPSSPAPGGCLPRLPVTGDDVALLPVLAVVLLGAGGAIVVALRRRST